MVILMISDIIDQQVCAAAYSVVYCTSMTLSTHFGAGMFILVRIRLTKWES